MERKSKIKWKVVSLSLLMALGGLLPSHLSAMSPSDRYGGLFGGDYYYDSDGLVYRSDDYTLSGSGGLLNQGFGATGSIISNQGFGGVGGDVTNQGFGGSTGIISNQTFGEAPVGNGLFLMLAAGMGYACLKRKQKGNN